MIGIGVLYTHEFYDNNYLLPNGGGGGVRNTLLQLVNTANCFVCMNTAVLVQ